MGPSRIVLAQPTSGRLIDQQSGAWMILARDSSSVTITRVRRRPPSTGAPPIVSRNVVARGSDWMGSNGHCGAASSRSGEIRRPTESGLEVEGLIDRLWAHAHLRVVGELFDQRVADLFRRPA